MSDDGIFLTASGIRIEVRKTALLAKAEQGVGCGLASCPAHGTPLLSLTLIHADGTALSGFLDLADVARLLDLIEPIAEAMGDGDAAEAPAPEARH